MGRWVWIVLWGGSGMMMLIVAVFSAAAANSMGFLALAAAVWLFYSAWRVYSAKTIVIRDMIGREVYRDTKRKSDDST
jgi:hypothetical protein